MGHSLFLSTFSCWTKNQFLHGAAAHLSLALTVAWVNKGTASLLPLWASEQSLCLAQQYSGVDDRWRRRMNEIAGASQSHRADTFCCLSNIYLRVVHQMIK